jgi:hypothetical protein
MARIANWRNNNSYSGIVFLIKAISNEIEPGRQALGLQVESDIVSLRQFLLLLYLASSEFSGKKPELNDDNSTCTRGHQYWFQK